MSDEDHRIALEYCGWTEEEYEWGQKKDAEKVGAGPVGVSVGTNVHCTILVIRIHINRSLISERLQPTLDAWHAAFPNKATRAFAWQ